MDFTFRVLGYDVPPGVMTSIKMTMKQTKYLEQPYGRCSPRDKRAPDE